MVQSTLVALLAALTTTPLRCQTEQRQNKGLGGSTFILIVGSLWAHCDLYTPVTLKVRQTVTPRLNPESGSARFIVDWWAWDAVECP